MLLDSRAKTVRTTTARAGATRGQFWPGLLPATAALILFLQGATMDALVEAEEGPSVNYSEAQVPSYELPDALVTSTGQRVLDVATWHATRRFELLEQFRQQVYGRSLPAPQGMRFEVVEQMPAALGGLAHGRRVRIHLLEQGEPGPAIPLVLYLPARADGPVPVFVGMHLFPSGQEPLPGKPLSELVSAEKNPLSPEEMTRLLAKLPGLRTAETILSRGYGIATLDAADFAPDDAEKYRQGVIGFYRGAEEAARQPDDGGALSAWAWGLSRALDYFLSEPAIDGGRVIVIGHSRRGKTALWAAAQDERFAMAISNNSGCGGAALSRRIFGETVEAINRRFPHWFCQNFRQYNDHEQDLPIDQHELLALVAPRPTFVASALEDGWADPHGEQLAAQAAYPVFQLLAGERAGQGVPDSAPWNQTVGGLLGYHLRIGQHALTDFDWLAYLDFADRYLPSTK